MTFSAMVVGRSPGPRAKIRLVAPRGMMLTSPRGVQWRAHQPARRGRASCRAASVTRIALKCGGAIAPHRYRTQILNERAENAKMHLQRVAKDRRAGWDGCWETDATYLSTHTHNRCT